MSKIRMWTSEVRIDLDHALRSVKSDPAQRRLVMLLFERPELSERRAGELLGWSAERLDHVARTLDADCTVGKKLRTRLRAYSVRERNKT